MSNVLLIEQKVKSYNKDSLLVLQKEIVAQVYEIIKDKSFTIHDVLLPYIEELFKKYPSKIDKKIETTLHKKMCENTYKTIAKNSYRVRKKKLARLITYILIDFIILEQ